MSFGKYVFEQSPAKYADKILVIDDEHLKRKENIDAEFRANGFEIVEYIDDLNFRIEYEADLKKDGTKIAVFSESQKYIPYDVLKRMSTYSVSMQNIFTEMDSTVLEELDRTKLDLVSKAYTTNFVKALNKKMDTWEWV